MLSEHLYATCAVGCFAHYSLSMVSNMAQVLEGYSVRRCSSEMSFMQSSANGLASSHQAYAQCVSFALEGCHLMKPSASWSGTTDGACFGGHAPKQNGAAVLRVTHVYFGFSSTTETKSDLRESATFASRTPSCCLSRSSRV
jgi:hypothetical protein